MNPLLTIKNTLFPKIKLIVVLGATSTGKSDLAVEIAKVVSGEIISADSRQVYKGLDIGSGKITGDEMKGVPHYMLDIVEPNEIFTVAQFQEQTKEIIKEISGRGKIPILCGGTGFYIQSIIDDMNMPSVAPNTTLRNELEKFGTEELFKQLSEIDPRRAKTIDKNNKRYLIRALEITDEAGVIPRVSIKTPYNLLLIGLNLPDKILKDRIYKRLIKRLEEGMVDEILGLINKGIKIDRLYELGLEYRYVTEYVVGKRSYDDMVQTLYTKICQFAKRQRTWFKKEKRIIWFDPLEEKKAIFDRVQMFID